MAKDMYCPHCGSYVGNCGHVSGGSTDPITLSGTCGCGKKYKVTCNGDCIRVTPQSLADQDPVL